MEPEREERPHGFLPKLPKDRVSYVFSDVADVFLHQAREKFQSYSFMQFETIDIENVAPDDFDVIIASNVLHATVDIRKTISNVRNLLKPGGFLVLWEATEPQVWFDVTFGLLSGWQSHDDPDRRPDSPLIEAKTWTRLLQDQDFSDVGVLPPMGSTFGGLGQHVMIAETPKLQKLEPIIPDNVDSSNISIGLENLTGKIHALNWVSHKSERKKIKETNPIWLIVSSESNSTAKNLEEYLKFQQKPVVRAHLKNTFASISDQTFYIREGQKEDIQKTIKAINSNINSPVFIECIFISENSLLQKSPNAGYDSIGWSQARIISSLLSGFHLLANKGNLTFWIVTHAAQVIPGQEIINEIDSFFWGARSCYRLGTPEFMGWNN